MNTVSSNQLAPRFVPLMEHPQLTQPIGDLVHAEWGDARGRTVAQTRARFLGEVAGKLPYTIVALVDDRLAGGATLRVVDSVDYLPGATPWICNVIVTPDARGRGIATELCTRLIEAARAHGYDETFLATTLAENSLYHRMGFTEVATSHHDGGSYVLRKAWA